MSLLRSPLFWLCVASFAVVGFLLIEKSHANRSWGFKDIVKNPDLWNAMAEDRSAVEQDAEAAQQWSAEQVAQAVTHFVFDVKTGSDAWGEKRILQKLGGRTHSAILGILADESVRAKLTAPTGTDLLPEAPINRLCDLLDEYPPAEVVNLLIPFLSDPSSQVRKSIALVIGNVGTPETVEPLQKALSDPDEFVRSYALMGLKRAVKAQRLNDLCKRELFGDLQRLIGEGKNADDATGLLLEFDMARAMEYFLSPVIFTPVSKSLHEALEALADRKIPVERDRLLSLIEELEETKLEYPGTCALAEALRLLGQHQHAGDRAFLETRTTHAEDKVAEGASAGLLALNGLDGFQQKLWDKESTDGHSARPVPQKYFNAVTSLDGEVNNGGHSQYFVNSSGDHWRDALAGLDAMGFQERAATLREAVAKFGINGPSENRQARQEQLAKLARRDDALFGSLDDRYYKCTEVVDVFTTRYVIKNADAFR